MWLDKVPDNDIQAPFPTKGWTRWSLEVTSNLGYSMILFYENGINLDKFVQSDNSLRTDVLIPTGQ